LVRESLLREGSFGADLAECHPVGEMPV
jgi:hypothetical protein